MLFVPDMENVVRKCGCAACAAVALLAASCQQGQLTGSSGGSLAYRNYPDAVTSIRDVDPAYRPYFAGQNSANYSIAEQRKAFYAARQTARTPVHAEVRRSASGVTVRKKSSSVGKAKKRAVSKKRVVSKKRTAKPAKASRQNKSAARRTPAGRKSSRRR